MDEQRAQNLLNQRGYDIAAIKQFPFGQNRDVFEFTTADQRTLIARFVKEGRWRDMQYDGPLSLERDRSMYALAKIAAKLPTPDVYGYHDVEGVPFLVVEKLPGEHWATFLKKNEYSLDAYLRSLQFLGADVAKAHAITLPTYGDLINPTTILPRGITNFATRLEHIIGLKLAKAGDVPEGILSIKELEWVRTYFSQEVHALEEKLNHTNYKPILILTNLHPMNFLVDEEGKPSGYPDLEFSQAGVKALEMYNMNLQLFSYFDQPTFIQARDAFFKGYTAAGGEYDQEDATNKQLETLLCAAHTLSSVSGYIGARDGLRDYWSDKFKQILFRTIHCGEMDYVAFADVIREKTQQPKQPKLP